MKALTAKIGLSNKTNALILFFLIALVVRAIYFFEFKENPYFDYVYPSHDSIVVHNGAVDICNGDLFLNKKGFKYPFYSYFVAGIYYLTGQKIYAVWAVQFVLGAVSTILIFLIGSSLFNPRIGAIACLIHALYPQNIFYEGVMLRASLTEFLAMLSFYCLLRLSAKMSITNLTFSGIALSLMIQCRPNTAVVLPFVFAYLYFGILRDYANKMKIVYFTTLITALALAGTPLLVRGIYVEKKIVLYDPSGPMVLLMGNLVDYDGAGWHRGSPRFERLLSSHGQEARNDYGWVSKTIFEEMVNHPIEFMGLYLRKFYYFFNNYEIPSNNNFYLHQGFSVILRNPLGNFSLVVALAFIGIIATLKDGRRLIPLYVYLLGMTGATVLFYNVSRLRVPAIPFYILFASSGVSYLVRLVADKRIVHLILAVTSAFALLFCLKSPAGHKVRPNDYGMLADIHRIKGSYDEAIELCRQSLEHYPNYFYTHRLLGRLYLKKRIYDKAILHLKRAVAIDPKSSLGHYYLSIAYYETREYRLAMLHQNRATELGLKVSQGLSEHRRPSR